MRDVNQQSDLGVIPTNGFKPEDKPMIHPFTALKTAMQADPDYVWTWHCNLAMAFYDAIPATLEDREIRHWHANEGAARFISQVFDINVRAYAQYPHKPTRKPRRQELQNCLDVQCAKGNWDCDEYMRGMANGLILAAHIADGAENDPPYKEVPKDGYKPYKTVDGNPVSVDQPEPEQLTLGVLGEEMTDHCGND